jgi:hypothetical protein
MSNARLLAFAAAAVLCAAPAMAQNVVAGFNGHTLDACDDCHSGAASLGFTADFFGNSYSSAYVSSNGYLTFNSGQDEFTPAGLGSSYTGQPIIAPFFADVDTQGTGTITYGTGTFNGLTAFGATWNAVGYYNDHTNPLNTFQVLLVDRSDVSTGDFDIYFNYDSIGWETGDFNGGHNGLGGQSASAGFNAGTHTDGTYYELPGSHVNGSLINGGSNALVSGSNIGDPGRYLFNVRNGVVQVPTGAVPEPATWAMMLFGFGAVGTSLRRKRRQEMAAA